jgi:cysteine-rich repeat protein
MSFSKRMFALLLPLFLAVAASPIVGAAGAGAGTGGRWPTLGRRSPVRSPSFASVRRTDERARCDARDHLVIPRGQRRHVLCADCSARAGTAASYVVTMRYSTVGYGVGSTSPGLGMGVGPGDPGSCLFQIVGGSAAAVPPTAPPGATAFSHGFWIDGQPVRAPGVSLEGPSAGVDFDNVLNATLPTALSVCFAADPVAGTYKILLTVNDETVAVSPADKGVVDTRGRWRTISVSITNATESDPWWTLSCDGAWISGGQIEGVGALDLSGSSLIVGRGFSGNIGEWMLHKDLPYKPLVYWDLYQLSHPEYGAVGELPAGACSVGKRSRIKRPPVSRLTFAQAAAFDCGTPLSTAISSTLMVELNAELWGDIDETGAWPRAVQPVLSMRGADACAPAAPVFYVIPTAEVAERLAQWTVTNLPRRGSSPAVRLMLDVREAVQRGNLDPECGNLVLFRVLQPGESPLGDNDGVSDSSSASASWDPSNVHTNGGRLRRDGLGSGHPRMEPIAFWIDPVFGCSPGNPVDITARVTARSNNIVIWADIGAPSPAAGWAVRVVAHASRSPGGGRLTSSAVMDVRAQLVTPPPVETRIPLPPAALGADVLHSKNMVISSFGDAVEAIGSGALTFDTTGGPVELEIAVPLSSAPSMVSAALRDDLAKFNGGGPAATLKLCLGFGFCVGVVDSVSSSTYVVRTPHDLNWVTTSTARTTGWHRAEMIVNVPHRTGSSSWSTSSVSSLSTLPLNATQVSTGLDLSNVTVTLRFDGQILGTWPIGDDEVSTTTSSSAVTFSATGSGGQDFSGAIDSVTFARLPTATPAGGPIRVHNHCGDGVLDLGEACDDGNTDAFDGCRGCAFVTPTFSCTGSPSVCTGGPRSCERLRVLTSEPLVSENQLYRLVDGSGIPFFARCLVDAAGRAWTKVIGIPASTFAPTSSGVNAASPVADHTAAHWKFSDALINEIGAASPGQTKRYLVRFSTEPAAFSYIEVASTVMYNDLAHHQGLYVHGVSRWCLHHPRAAPMSTCAEPTDSVPGVSSWLTSESVNPGAAGRSQYSSGGLWDLYTNGLFPFDDCKRVFSLAPVSAGTSLSNTVCYTPASTTLRCFNSGASCGTGYLFVAIDIYVLEPLTSCGDGELDVASGEQCDDGNTIAGDGCGATCLVELISSPRAFGGFSTCGELGAVHPLLNSASMPHPMLWLAGFDVGTRFTTRCHVDSGDPGP